MKYRQKCNFWFSTDINKLGFSFAEWNFFESGHGKGIPDAVGGRLKRKADSNVKFGCDITTAKTFVDSDSGEETEVSIIEESEKAEFQRMLDNLDLQPIAGTMKIYQLISPMEGIILFRDFSCM